MELFEIFAAVISVVIPLSIVGLLFYPLFKNDKNKKELKIKVPKGYEISEEESSFERIIFKKIPFTLSYILDSFKPNKNYNKKIDGISKLIIVARHLNNGWVPDVDDPVFIIYLKNNELTTGRVAYCCEHHIAVFESERLAKRAISILGEETIKDALRIY